MRDRDAAPRPAPTEELLAGGRRRTASFRDFVAARQARLLRSAYVLCGDRHRAEDLLQGALTRTAARWAQVHDGDPEAYVRRSRCRTGTAPRRTDEDHLVVEGASGLVLLALDGGTRPYADRVGGGRYRRADVTRVS